MKRHTLAIAFAAAGLLNATAALCGDGPAVRLDASAAGTIETGREGTVLAWNSTCGRVRFTTGTGHPGPRIVPGCINGLPALRFDANCAALAISAANCPRLKFGQLHVFVVARFVSGGGAEQAVLGMGKEYPAFNLADDGRNFRLFTGDAGHQRPEGISSDDRVHLFEFDHVIDLKLDANSARTHWPGEFRIDGALCGKVFQPAVALAAEKLTLGNYPDGSAPFAGDVAEVVIFNTPLDKARIGEIRSSLARKWGVELGETDLLAPDIPRLTEHRVGPARANSAFAYFGECPESPDGRRIAYVVYPEADYSKTRVGVDLWVCDRDLKNHRLVAEKVVTTNYHNGSMGHWVDNDRFVLGGDGYQEVRVVDMNTGKTVFGPYTRCWPGGIAHQGMVLLHAIQGSNVGEAGIYRLDTRSGEISCIVRASQFGHYYDEYAWRGNREAERWRFVHGKYSPDGKRIAFSVVPRGGPQYFFLADADGRNIRVLGDRDKMPGRGEDKPLHWHWYDNDHFYGVDQESKDGTPNDLRIKLWDLYGNYVRTLAGQGDHTAMSYDKKLFAGDSFYFDDPSWLVVYRDGEVRPAAVAFEQPGIYPMWVVGAHANPAFSRDGRRLYYKRPVGDSLFQAYYVDLTPVLIKNE